MGCHSCSPRAVAVAGWATEESVDAELGKCAVVEDGTVRGSLRLVEGRVAVAFWRCLKSR